MLEEALAKANTPVQVFREVKEIGDRRVIEVLRSAHTDMAWRRKMHHERSKENCGLAKILSETDGGHRKH